MATSRRRTAVRKNIRKAPVRRQARLYNIASARRAAQGLTQA